MVSRLLAAAAAALSFAHVASAQFVLQANPPPANNGGSPGWAIFMDLQAQGGVPLRVTHLVSANTGAAGAAIEVETFVRVGTALGGPVGQGPGSSPAGWTSLGIVAGVQGPQGSTGVSEPIDIPDILVVPGQIVGVAFRFTLVGPRYFGTGTPPYQQFSDGNLHLTTGDARSAPFTPTGSFFTSRGLVGLLRYELDQQQLEIHSIEPNSATEGEIVVIRGRGFGNNPDNICAVQMMGTEAVPFEVLETKPERIVARVGPIPDDAVPGPIMVGLGEGDRGTFAPAFPDVIPEDPNGTWIWDRANGPAAMGPFFFPRPVPPPPNIRYFHGKIMNGRLCVTLDERFMPNTYIRVFARLHNHQMQMGADLEAFCIRLRRPGDPLFVAHRICDVLRCAFLRRGIVVNCDVDVIGPGQVKITVTKKDAQGRPVPIDWGNLIICREKPRMIRRFGMDFSPFFGANLDDITQGVLVGNLGGTGQDGATMDLAQAGGLNVKLRPIRMTQPGAVFRVAAWGSLNTEPHAFLGAAELRNNGREELELRAAFGDLGAQRAMVEVHDQGQFVGSIVLPVGELGALRPIPGLPLPPVGGCGKVPPTRFPPFPPCFIIRTEGPFRFGPLDGQFVGDELRILAADGNGEVTNLELYDIAAGGVGGEFVVVNAERTSGCYPDCDQSTGPGVLDIFDFLCFGNLFAVNAPYACNCDVSTGPGICDIFDFLCFGNAFAAGCR